jgi:drug/metabolite transporter (DMT)-like permease
VDAPLTDTNADTDADAARRAVLLATLAVVVAAFCWGLNAVFAKGAFEAGIPPARMAEARTAVAGIPLIAYLALFRRDLLIPRRAFIGPIVLFGLGLVAVNWSYYTAIDRIPVGVAISLQDTAPVLVLVGVALVARRSPGGNVWVAGLLTLIGAVLVSGAYNGLRDLDGLGVAAGIGSAIAFAAYLLSAEAAGRRGGHPATVLAGGLVVASIAWGILLPWWGWPIDRLAEPEVALRVLGVGLVGTLFPFLLVVNALRRLPAAVAGIAATTEPVFAAGLAWLLLNQSLGALQLLGGGLVVGGVVLAQFARR